MICATLAMGWYDEGACATAAEATKSSPNARMEFSSEEVSRWGDSTAVRCLSPFARAI
jgi:hypothetical protein